MATHIPEDKLLEIRDAAAIEDVVGQHVKLEARGKDLWGLCPFHADSKPSFKVSPDKGIFYCFGCQAGGNAISFLMQYHKLSFPEAVTELARRYGITITPRDLGPEGAKRAQRRQTGYQVLALAADFYRDTLKGQAGKAGRDYLERRGLTPAVIEAYGLGYAPSDWDALARHLRSKGVSPELAQEGGLLMPRTGGGHYDRFRDRIIFPIADRQGRTVAFGGRIVGEGEPKYLNSPESPLYSKGRNLYGLPQAAAALRRLDLALLVEGYLDLLALRVHGVEPVLATLGTALTREQVRLLKNQVSRVVLVFDGDAAGGKAMRRAFPLFAEERLQVRILPLPPGQDPDSYVAASGPELFGSPWEAAQPFLAYLLDQLVREHGLDIEGRVRIINEVRPAFQSLKDPVERDLWLRFAAGRLSLEEGSLRRSLAEPGVMPTKAGAGRGLAISLERNLLRHILHHPASVTLAELEEWAREFEDPDLKQIMDLVVQCCRSHGGLDYPLLLQGVEEEDRRRQICALALEEPAAVASGPLVGEFHRAINKRRLEKTRQAIKAQLAQASSQEQGEELLALQAQITDIDRQLEALKSQAPMRGENG
ncbi:MAG: DNA primase [Deltaproteobacteria bacterium]|nr:DNA primase [Deltaproteobacteria bacterium]